MTEKDQSLYCTECEKYVYFNTKKEKSGNLIIVCDHCGHQHCRRVVDGVVTSDRWDSRDSRVNKKYGVETNGS